MTYIIIVCISKFLRHGATELRIKGIESLKGWLYFGKNKNIQFRIPDKFNIILEPCTPTKRVQITKKMSLPLGNQQSCRSYPLYLNIL